MAELGRQRGLIHNSMSESFLLAPIAWSLIVAEQANQLEFLLASVRAGDNGAAQELVVICAPKILSIIRRRLHQPLQTLYDAPDILQEVWKDFFSMRVHEQSFRMETELICYLAGMARHIILELERRYYDTQKRDIRRRVPLDQAVQSKDQKLIDWRPSPEEQLTTQERWDRILQTLAPRSCRAAQMLRAGHTQSEIIEFLGMSKRTLGRVLGRVRECFVIES